MASRAGRDRSPTTSITLRRLRWHRLRTAAASRPASAFGFAVGARRDPAVAAFQASMSWPAHGSKSDSSGSWAGRSASGTWIRLTRTRYQTAERPRIPSTRMSAGSRYAATSGWRAFQRSRPSSASSLNSRPRRSRRPGSTSCGGRSASVASRPTRSAGRRSGRRLRPRPPVPRRRPAAARRLAATRLVFGLRPARLATAGRAAARRPASRSSAATARRPGPSASSRALSSSSASSEPTASSIPAPGSPIAA